MLRSSDHTEVLFVCVCCSMIFTLKDVKEFRVSSRFSCVCLQQLL